MWSAGASRLEQLEHEAYTHHHDHHQLVIGLQGEVVFDLPTAGQRGFSQGKACLLPSLCEHSFQGIGDNKVLIVDVIPGDSLGLPLDKGMIEILFSAPCYITLEPQLINLTDSLVKELQTRHNDFSLQQYVSGILLNALYHRLVSDSTSVHGDDSRLNIQRIDELIRQNISEKLSVEDLAKSCHMSTSQFHLRFRQRTGQTPHQYILDQRVEQASWLLRHSSMTIADVAAESGFTTQSALSHVIKTRFGISPGQLRKQYRE